MLFISQFSLASGCNMANLSLKMLEALIEVARTKNFSEAAKSHRTTQATMSRQIQSLESFLGKELICRRVVLTDLTDAGREFLPVAQQFVKAIRKSKAKKGRRPKR